MIDRATLQSMTPAARAALIYSEARSAVSRQLWQAALGTRDDDARAIDRPERRTALDTLLDQLQRRAEPATAPPQLRPAVLRTMPDATDDPPRRAPSDPIDGLGINARHAATLADAAARTGIPAAALAAIVDAEAGKARDGSWQAYSRNPRSSAAGLGQFLSRTWEGLAETPGTWLHALASARSWLGGDGRVLAAATPALLALRYDPVAAINGIADYARRNLDGLRRAGVDAAGDVGATARLAYLGHHLGLGDAIRFLRRGGLSPARARVLLGAQVGASGSARRIVEAGDATAAHRSWLLGYLDRKVRADRYAGIGNVA